ncbi:MAG TPA: DUF5658 family protein [Chthonomonadaceae bacterium]|nr:DUF5658 family protein [Chthonomonadaceae bacterium]
MRIAKETWIIMAIGLADLATTILFIKHHGAQEANPLFQRYWEMGLAAFILAKVALLVGPLYLLEWARLHRPRFTSWALRGAIVAYLLMYGVGVARLNGVPAASAAELEMADTELLTPPRPHMQAHFRPTLHAISETATAGRPVAGATTVVAY